MTKPKRKPFVLSEAQRLKNEAVAAQVRAAEGFAAKQYHNNPRMDAAAALLRSRSLDKLLIQRQDELLAELRARPQIFELA